MRRDTERDEAQAITLRGGLSIPVAALRLAWQLEGIGVSMCVDGDDLVLRPRQLVPAEDVPRLRQYRRDIMRLIAYCEEPPA